MNLTLDTIATIDLEFTALRQDAKILAIGMVVYSLADNRELTSYYQNINLDTQDGVIDNSTFKWWLAQSNEARQALLGTNANIADALHNINRLIEKYRVEAVFGMPSHMDNGILHLAYAKAGITPAWPYYRNHDQGTVRLLFNMLKGYDLLLNDYRTGEHHNALDDARTQMGQLVDMIYTLQR